MHDRIHIHNALFLNHKEAGNNVKSSFRKEAWDDHSKWSKGDRDRHVSYDVTSRCSRKKCIQMNFITKEKQLHRLRKRNLQLPTKKCGGRAGSKELAQNNNTPYKHLIHLKTGAVVYSLSPVWLFATPRAVAHQAPLSMRFPSKPIGVGYHFLLQGILPTQGLNPCLLQVSCAAGRFFITEPAGKPWNRCWRAPDGHKSTRAFNDTCPQEMSWDKSSEKNSKRGQVSGSQFQEANYTHKA